MKFKIGLFAIILLIATKITAQNVSVEKSIWGIQTGFLGVWVYNESRLTNKIALRSEIGYDVGYRDGGGFDNVFAGAPVLTIEPRWYYNLYKRNKKGKSISNNSANFIALKVSYNLNGLIISNEDNLSINEQLSFVPYWAIKRVIGNHFTYETGLGIGYKYIFYDNQTVGDITAELHLRIGYTF